MATPQQYIQSMAQQASPFVPNNGNPNTVYNTAATPFGGTAGAWQDISPFGGTNINQHWSFAPAPTAVPVGAYADPSAQFWNNATELAPAQFNLDQSGAVWPGGESPFIPAPAPVPAPGTGITVPDGVETIVHPHDPNFRPTPVGGSGGQNAGDLGGDSYHQLTQGNAGPGGTLHLNPNPGVSIPAGSPGWLNNMGNAISRGWEGLKDAMGFRGGSISAMQVLDWFLPGDLVDANTGQVNWDQAAKSALNVLSPGLGALAEAAINNGMLGEQLQEWLNGMQFERGAIEQSRQQGISIDDMARDLFDNFSARFPSVPLNVRDIPMPSVTIGPLSNPNTSAAPQTGNTAIGADTATGSDRNPFDRMQEEQAAAAAAAPGPRGHRAAGSTTIAEGAAAQDMFADMTDFSATQNRLDQIGRELSKRMYQQMR